MGEAIPEVVETAIAHAEERTRGRPGPRPAHRRGGVRPRSGPRTLPPASSGPRPRRRPALRRSPRRRQPHGRPPGGRAPLLGVRRPGLSERLRCERAYPGLSQRALPGRRRDDGHRRRQRAGQVHPPRRLESSRRAEGRESREGWRVPRPPLRRQGDGLLLLGDHVRRQAGGGRGKRRRGRLPRAGGDHLRDAHRSLGRAPR